MNTLTNEAIKSRIEALKNSHAQNNNAVTSTYLMDAKAFEELLSLRAKLASVNANCDKAIITGIVDRYQKDTANYALVNRCAALEVQLAELRGQEPVAWIVGSEEIDEFKRGREVTVMRDGDEEELEKIALYIRPVPPAASNLLSAGWQACRDGHWFSIKAEDVPHYRDNEEVPVREVYATSTTPAASQPYAVPDYFASLVGKARIRADKAMRKFPQPNYVLNKVAEESGEVIKAVIHYTEGREEWSNVEGEIIDNLAMLIRLVIEGDQVIGFTPPEACRAAMLQPEIKVETDNTTQQFESLSEPPTSR